MPTDKLKLGDRVIINDINSFMLGMTGEIKIIDDITFANKTRYLVKFNNREECFFGESLRKKVE